MFTLTLFIITPKWKQPKYLSTVKWESKPWYIHMMEYYAAIRRNKLIIKGTTWMSLKCRYVNEASSQSYMNYDSIYMTFWKRWYIGTKTLMVARNSGWGRNWLQIWMREFLYREQFYILMWCLHAWQHFSNLPELCTENGKCYSMYIITKKSFTLDSVNMEQTGWLL